MCEHDTHSVVNYLGKAVEYSSEIGADYPKVLSMLSQGAVSHSIPPPPLIPLYSESSLISPSDVVQSPYSILKYGKSHSVI